MDKIYRPFDNLVLAVTLHENGQMDKQVLGSLTEAIKAQPQNQDAWKRLKAIFTDPSLQMVSFTITEKGYVEEDFLAYIGDENIVSFPWTIIDKITPRPSEAAGPMISELQAQMAGIEFGNPQSLTDQLRGILSNKNIFGIDLYASGIGEQIEEMVREQLAGPGAVRKTLQKYLHTAAPK